MSLGQHEPSAASEVVYLASTAAISVWPLKSVADGSMTRSRRYAVGLSAPATIEAMDCIIEPKQQRLVVNPLHPDFAVLRV